MAIPRNEIDPNGDIIIRLRASNSIFATWNEPPRLSLVRLPSPLSENVNEPEPEPEPEPEYEPDSERELESEQEPEQEQEQEPLSIENEPAFPIAGRPTSDQITLTKSEPSHDEWKVEMRVSSHHLILASPQAKRMLVGAWMEQNTLKSQGLLVMEEKDWDAEALLILMNIIHCKNKSVPRKISLEMLARVAVLVDYYECYEAVEICVEMWMAHLRNTVPKTYCRELVLWICVSWVFRQPSEFSIAMSVALKQSEGPLHTMELPIPERIVRDIDERRQESIKHMIAALHDCLDRMREGPQVCSFECDSILLGALTKELYARNLISPRPVPPFLGFSLEQSARSLNAIQALSWSKLDWNYENHGQRCALKDRIDPIIDSLMQQKSLTLEDYNSQT